MCGLKPEDNWIDYLRSSVTPFVGVWIEILSIPVRCLSPIMSHPSWVCGLKLGGYGLVRYISRRVTPFVGVWIETRMVVWLATMLR